MQPKIVTEYPPNYSEIKQVFNPPETTVFVYGDTIYNPQGGELHQDVVIHEQVHIEQQKKFASPDLWYAKYLYDPDFRLEQELQAYRKQYQFLKEILTNKHLKEALQELAHALSNDYKLDISYNQAESRIKKYEKLA